MTTNRLGSKRWHNRCTGHAPVFGRRFAAFSLVALGTARFAPSALAQAPAQFVDDGDAGRPADRSWRVVSGLRLEQWIAPVDDHLRFNVRLTLPEMAFGDRFSIETFNWERLDVAKGTTEQRESGTVYHLLSARYRREADRYSYFIGVHTFSWSGHSRPLTPWLGLRVGSTAGPSIAAEAHLLGLGPAGGPSELGSALDDAELTVSIDGPRIGGCLVAARGRARDARHPDLHQREQMASLGVVFDWGRRRLFVGVGVQHLSRRAVGDGAEAAAVPTGARMESGRTPSSQGESTAVMLHLDAETLLPRSLLAL